MSSIKTKVRLCELLIFLVSLWVLPYFAVQMLQRHILRMLREQQKK